MTSETQNQSGAATLSRPPSGGAFSTLVRIFGWTVLATAFFFLINNYMTFWMGWPGEGVAFGFKAGSSESGTTTLTWLQLGFYPAGFAAAVAYVFKTRERPLRDESQRISNINTFLIRAAFFAVLYVGIADAIISFLRVEGFLPVLFGDELGTELSRSQFRGTFVHMPLIGLAVVTACFSRTLGFHWLGLLAVIAELLIVITRFLFSYEQAFMSDLVRFWYAGLFLFASAYTLIEEGHVRVDIAYTNFSPKYKGLVNAVGSLLLGLGLCWTILAVGLAGKSAIINSPLLAFETTQTGFGMYVKYLMAGFLGIFAISMMIQFVSYLLDAVADFRGDPGGRDHDVHAIQ